MPYIGIVDDNPTVLLHMRILLERAGFADVRTHTDPRASLAAFKLEPPSVLLVDYLMPGLDGIELLGQLQQAGTTLHTPVAMVSGAEDLESMRLCAYRAGAIEVLAKPVNPHDAAMSSALPAGSAAAAGGAAMRMRLRKRSAISWPVIDLGSTSITPACHACNLMGSVNEAATSATGVRGDTPVACSAVSNSMPFMPGIEKSTRSTSGCLSRRLVSASNGWR